MNFRQYIQGLCQYFRDACQASEYTYTIQWNAEPSVHQCEGVHTMAEICIDTAYLWIVLMITDQMEHLYRQGNFRDIAETICHEFSHVLTEPLYEAAIPGTPPVMAEHLGDLRERQTQRICNAIFSQVPKSVWSPQPSGDTEELRQVMRDMERLERRGDVLSKKIEKTYTKKPKARGVVQKVVSINRLEPIVKPPADSPQAMEDPA